MGKLSEETKIMIYKRLAKSWLPCSYKGHYFNPKPIQSHQSRANPICISPLAVLNISTSISSLHFPFISTRYGKMSSQLDLAKNGINWSVSLQGRSVEILSADFTHLLSREGPFRFPRYLIRNVGYAKSKSIPSSVSDLSCPLMLMSAIQHIVQPEVWIVVNS